MDGAAFGFLLTDDGQELLRRAHALYDGSHGPNGSTGPNPLAVASSLRKLYEPEQVAAALTQVELRRRAGAKFGASASTMYFTADGLEQATHPTVARHRARRLSRALAAGGNRTVVDIGCGIGSDLLALGGEGIEVSGVERDPVTAAVAQANLAATGRAGEVVVGDGETVDRSGAGATFVDPARRRAGGRTFDPAAYSPPWSFVETVLSGPAVAKVAPGIPHDLVPDGVEAEWVSLDGGLREAALWSVGPSRVRARATVLRGEAAASTLTDRDPSDDARTAPPGRYVYEPDDAVIRAHLVTTVSAAIGGWLLDEHLAYVAADRHVDTPFARAYEVLEVLPFKEKQLRAALRARDVGALTIKKRGIQVTPEELRSRLGLTGSTPATLILSRTARSSVALLVTPVHEA